jgi:hypothetical protein
MINHVWSVVCERSSIDQDTNLISINDVVENINIPDEVEDDKIKGLVSFKNEVISSYYRVGDADSVERATQLIVVIAPDGKEIARNTFDIVFTKGIVRHRCRIKGAGVPVVGLGVHLFEVRLKRDIDEDFQTVARIPVTIKKLSV